MTSSIGRIARPLPPGGKPRGGTLTGDIRSHKVTSGILHDKRKVLVYLPPSYEQNPDRHYKVLYTNDGQSVFDDRTAIHHSEWGLDEAAESLMKDHKMEDVIIVAVANGGDGESRCRDYTPAPDARYGGGQANNYLKFLTEELKPQVDATYRTQTGPESTGILGSSLGGLFSLHAGLAAPATFGMVGAVSPSLWYAGKDMLKRLSETDPSAPHPQKIWMDMGTREANPEWSLTPVEEFQEAKGLIAGLDYQEEENFFPRLIEGGEHTNEAWRSRIGDFLRTMYPVEGAGSGK